LAVAPDAGPVVSGDDGSFALRRLLPGNSYTSAIWSASFGVAGRTVKGDLQVLPFVRRVLIAAVLEEDAHGKGQQQYEQCPPKMPMKLKEILVSVGVLRYGL
jgi:hypothetical protein